MRIQLHTEDSRDPTMNIFWPGCSYFSHNPIKDWNLFLTGTFDIFGYIIEVTGVEFICKYIILKPCVTGSSDICVTCLIGGE
jgi:hypothetical protein